MTKQEKYQTLLPQIESLVAGETDVIAVLDIDSTAFNTFDETDKHFLEKIVAFL